MKEITFSQLNELNPKQDSVTIIDVREPDEFRAGAIQRQSIYRLISLMIVRSVRLIANRLSSIVNRACVRKKLTVN